MLTINKLNKIKKTCKYYEVTDMTNQYDTRDILAKSYIDAVVRYCKRYVKDSKNCKTSRGISATSRYQVKLSDSNNHWANFVYFK